MRTPLNLSGAHKRLESRGWGRFFETQWCMQCTQDGSVVFKCKEKRMALQNCNQLKDIKAWTQRKAFQGLCKEPAGPKCQCCSHDSQDWDGRYKFHYQAHIPR